MTIGTYLDIIFKKFKVLYKKNIRLVLLVLLTSGCEDSSSGGNYNIIIPTPSVCAYVEMYNFNDVPVGQSKTVNIGYECSQTTTLKASISGVTCDEYSVSPMTQTIAAG